MTKKVRLTESDLIRLVKKVIKEQEDLGDSVKEFNRNMVLVVGADKETVSHVLSRLPKSLKFLAIRDSEFADFQGIDLCSFPELIFVNLRNTENNFEENVECEYDQMGSGLYEFNKE